MTAQAPAAATTGNPLTPEQHQQIATANQRARKIRRAAAVAAFNGWTLGLCAVVSTLFAVFSLAGFIVAAALWIITIVEFRGRKRLLNFEPQACRLLGWNQIALMTLLVGYCAWSILWAYRHPDPQIDFAIPPEVRDQVNLIKELYLPVTLIVYGSVIAVAILVQGGNALYYFTRERLVREYLDETEPWVLEVQKSAATK